MSVKPIPEGFHSLTPNLVCKNAVGAIDFYIKVFGAKELSRVPGPHGEIMHAELQIGDTRIFLNDTMSKTGPHTADSGESNPMYLHMYVPDVDTVFNRAVMAGARADMQLQDMFWGDRYGKITDPFGQQWGLATHIEDVASEEMERRQKELFSKAAAGRS
jgi:PhnB protein